MQNKKHIIIEMCAGYVGRTDTYTITIVSVGEGDYTDSDPYKLNFTYNKPDKTYTFNEGENLPEEEFIKKLTDLGVNPSSIVGKQGAEDDLCAGEVVTVSSSNLDGKTLTLNELLNMEIEYTYCRVLEND